MGRYQTSITVTYHRFTDDHAKVRENAIRARIQEMFPDAHVATTTYTEKPLSKATAA